MSSPLIGITCSTSLSARQKRRELGGESLQDHVPRTYIQAVVASGGTPLLIPLVEELAVIEWMVSRLNGILLTGGVDVNPTYYQREPHLNLGTIDSAKDRLECQLTQLALRADIPILGICRGIQMLNVAAGGTLYQDIPAERSAPVLKHMQDAPMRTLTHSVSIEPGTQLYALIRQERIRVNSHHHQAVQDLAPGFRSTAFSPDGLIEGIEHPAKPFVVGVQWHPEATYQEDMPSQQVFRGFIDAAGQQEK
ncbi:gamma-glutamyl-gamma-aminobutyrate hydrolase family protein [candidate division KSB3 bacterium]|uniref:Gamma-glutamyl-gamma-aminobutyrate hydrolase family protein n=1 Tax=candidate division KSB3 bacterium TaxID=2044937 RepID=A0A9D5Q5K3_9BACT|nr:gamma-glutamyl-gamma-aminobutyrate hydrolase family protein [candidate division KSB3 bacterium]MBD3324327.1 gamma-glutamyl-gamma-aminobutyrate hydrolase family protein [candidate division KSB3 bacterium]